MSNQLEPGIWWDEGVKSYVLAMPIHSKEDYSDGESLSFYWLHNEKERDIAENSMGYRSGHPADYWVDRCQDRSLKLVVGHKELAKFFDLVIESAEENKDET